VETRKRITEQLKKKVWKNEYGNEKTGICPVEYCKNILSNKKFGFQCGHIISLCNKGPTTENNLKPICTDCNIKMSSTNWSDYVHELKKQKIWSDSYDDDHGECDFCNKSITIENFYLVTKHKKIKISCRKCYK
jgi:hypothetical protein